MSKPIYRRIVLKMSGEALTGTDPSVGPIDPEVLDRLVQEIMQVRDLGIQIAVVVGGGNFFRGRTLVNAGISRITADHMGMMGTVMNALALRDAFERALVPVRVLSAIPISGVADHFNLRKAIHHLEQDRVVVFSGGTGNPLVTTDSAASLRGIEINADVLLKATQVDGIYDKDPTKHADALLHKHLSYKEALDQELGVMDLAAFCQSRDHNLPIRVFNVGASGALLRAVTGFEEGTRVDHQKGA